MLQILRNKAQSTFIQIIVVIIALVFIFWGVGSNMMNNTEAAITVNGEEISFNDFQIAYDRASESLAQQYGGNLPREIAEQLGIKQRVINQLIQSAILRQGARAMGIVVSEEEIQKTITSMIQFQGDRGFDMDKYQSILSMNGLTPHKFETNMQHDMLAQKTVQEIGKFAIIANPYEVEELYREDNAKVSVTYTQIDPEQYLKEIEVDDEELAAWFETVQENYKTEPQLKLRFLNFSYDEVGKKIAIDESSVTSYYEENKGQFTTPEKRQARHILIRTTPEDGPQELQEKEKRAGEILMLAKASDDFASLAQQYSEGPSKENGGDLGLFTRDQMVKPFGDAVFTLATGEISEVVKTSFGFHIIKLEQIQPEVTRTLEEARDLITSTLQYQEAQKLAFQLADSAYEGIIGAGSLQAFAEANSDQPVITTDFFKRSEPPAEYSLDGEFLEKAFALNKGELSSLVKTSSGYFIIFVEDEKEPEIPALADVIDQVREDYLSERSQQLAGEAAASLLEELRAGKTLEQAAEDGEFALEKTPLLDRQGTVQTDFPSSLMPQIFTLSQNEPLPESPAMVDGSYYVFSFLEREIPDVDSDNSELEQYRQRLLASKQQQLLAAFISHFHNEAEIIIHSSL